jgi:hypothetical protein
MGKVRIKVITIGHLPFNFDKYKIETWNSGFFELTGEIEHFTLPCDSDGPDWEFTDNRLEPVLPEKDDGDFLVAIVNVPIQDNWYTRIIDSKVVITFHEIKEVLESHNIPLENIVYRLLYAYSLAFKATGGLQIITRFSHDETRGCLFDMNGIKTDIVYSCQGPIICQECSRILKQKRLSENAIRTVQREIAAIQKPLFYRIAGLIRKHPLWSLAISCVSAVVLGAVGSLIASVVYELFVKYYCLNL